MKKKKKKKLCYLLLTKTEKEFDSLEQDLNKLLEDLTIIYIVSINNIIYTIQFLNKSTLLYNIYSLL